MIRITETWQSAWQSLDQVRSWIKKHSSEVVVISDTSTEIIFEVTHNFREMNLPYELTGLDRENKVRVTLKEE